MQTLCAIAGGIKNEEFFLRAGNAKNMNDPNDCYYLINLIQQSHHLSNETIAQYRINKDKYDSPYLISLSSKKDDLHLWTCYGDDGKGICLGLDKVDIEAACGKFYTRYKLPAKLHSCKYYMSISDLPQDFQCYITQNDSYQLFRDISCTSNIIKHPCYEYENEYRVVITHSQGEISFDTYDKERDAIFLNIPLSAIKQIIVGPCANFETIRNIFSPYFPNTEFVKSAIPYRSK